MAKDFLSKYDLRQHLKDIKQKPKSKALAKAKDKSLENYRNGRGG